MYFTEDFFPTPPEVIEHIMQQYDVVGKTVLEPSAGNGNIVSWLKKNGADVIACEKHAELRHVLSRKCPVIAEDFLQVTADKVSHIKMIVMNPPFTNCEGHIQHAYNIAPAGCEIVSICPKSRFENRYSSSREQLSSLVEMHGYKEDLGQVFARAERKTTVEVVCIHMRKPGTGYGQEFAGFFMDDEKETESGSGIMPYSFTRDIVNRYVEAVKVFDQQLEIGIKMKGLIGGFFRSEVAFTSTIEGQPLERSKFKKDLQKSAWNFIFNKMNMEKYSTKGLKEDINKFVEQQQHIPFTMRNIYRMIEIVVGTQSQRMDRAMLEVFDRLTERYHDNRYMVEGWKTNSHFMLNPKFIIPYLATISYSGGMGVTHNSGGNVELVDDFQKALCHMTGKNYEDFETLWSFFQNKKKNPQDNSYNAEYVKYQFNTWYNWGFFRVKGFKKGTMHFEFIDHEICWKFNQHIARIKGYPLPEFNENRKAKKAA
jgi:predicted RNA methylase